MPSVLTWLCRLVGQRLIVLLVRPLKFAPTTCRTLVSLPPMTALWVALYSIGMAVCLSKSGLVWAQSLRS